MSLWLYAPIGFLIGTAIAMITVVGKPRKPLDGPTAAVIFMVQAALIGCILKGGGAL